MKRTGWVVVIVVALVAASCSSGGSKPATEQASPSSTDAGGAPSPSQSQYDLIRADIATHGLTKDLALEQFALVFGGLAGVTVRDGLPSDPLLSGTSTIEQVIGFWPDYTDAQRQAISKALNRQGASKMFEHGSSGGGAGSTPTPSTATPIPPASGDSTSTTQAGFSGSTPTAQLISTGGPHVQLVGGGAPASLTNDQLVEAAAAYADGIDDAIAQHTGAPPLPKILYTVDDSSIPDAEALAFSSIWDESVNPPQRFSDGACHTTLVRHYLDTGALSAQAFESILAHEMTHCYQQRELADFTDAVTFGKSSQWASDGEADWVMMTLFPTGDDLPALQKHWREWTQQPETQLFSRTYAAQGFFGHLSDTIGVDATWQRLLPAVKAVDSVPVFDALVQGDEKRVFDYWAASYFRVSSSKAWDMSGPGPVPPATPNPAIQAVSVGPGNDTDLGPAPGFAAKAYKIDNADVSGTTDIIELTLTSGNGAVRDDAGLDQVLDVGDRLNLCLKGDGCECPPGTQGSVEATVPAQLPVDVGVSGGRRGGFAYAQGFNLDDFCKQPNRPPEHPPPPPCAADCGGSTADPHVTTYDGRRYDLQTAGEHWLTRSTSDGFGVQVRQEPFPGSNYASLNTAAATKIGDKRVSFTAESGGVILRVDGEEQYGTEIDLSGAKITMQQGTTGFGYVVTWDDGTRLIVLPSGRYGITVKVAIPAERKGKMEGLLGDGNGDRSNDLVVRGGQQLADDASETEVDRTFGPSWKIAASDSWFDYADGKTSASYDIPGFPTVIFDTSTSPARDRAESVCRAAGVTDDDILQSCIFDVVATGELAYAWDHAGDQAVSTAVVEAKGSGGGGGVSYFDGDVQSQTDEPNHQFDAHEGDVVEIGGTSDCVDGGFGYELDGPDGAYILSQLGCLIGRVVLPQDGTYTLRVNTFQDRTGSYHVPLTRVRPDRTADVSLGSTITGTIDQHAAHDVYHFEANPGDAIAFASTDCDGGNSAVAIVDPDGVSVLTALPCREGRFDFTKAGTYTLIVNAVDNGGPSSYRIPLRRG